MPSKGASRTTNHATTATIAPVAGPAVVVRASSTQTILAEPARIQAVAGAPIAAGAATVPAQIQADPTAPIVTDIDKPPLVPTGRGRFFTPSLARHRTERRSS